MKNKTAVRFSDIRLEQAQIVESIRKRYGHDASSHAFPMLYLWRGPMGLSLALSEDFFVVRSTWRGENCYFFPCGSESLTEDFIYSHLEDREFRLCYMRECDADFLTERFPGRFELNFDRDASEYLYDREEQVQLSGGKFLKQRSRLHRFLREHTAECTALTADMAGIAREITLRWASMQEKLPAFNDVNVALEALELMAEFRMYGVLVYADGEPVSFALGCPISPKVFDLCLMKQLLPCQGLSVYTMREFCRSIPEDFSIVNMEEDLGIEGLRIHKCDMRPAGFGRMWEGKLKTL